MKIFIDDERTIDMVYDDVDDWLLIRSASDFYSHVYKHGIPNTISFDHDLGIKDDKLLPTGFDIANWIINKDLDDSYFIPDNFTFVVHSANPVGKKNIETILNNYIEFKHVYLR